MLINNLNKVIIKKSCFFIFLLVFSIIALHVEFAMSAKSVPKSISITKIDTVLSQSLAYLLELHRKHTLLSPEILGDKEKLVATLENLYNTNPNDEKIALVYASMLADINNLAKANEIIKKIRYPNKHGNLYYYYETKIAIGTGDLKRAEKSFKYLKYPHRDPAVWHLEGLLISYKGDEKHAKQVWEALLKKYPENAITYYDLGVAYTIFKEYDNAVKAFQKAWELLGVNNIQEKQKARLQQGYLEIIIFNNTETGTKYFQEAIDLAPNSPELKEFYDKIENSRK